jgi:hypothetical protein
MVSFRVSDTVLAALAACDDVVVASVAVELVELRACDTGEDDEARWLDGTNALREARDRAIDRAREAEGQLAVMRTERDALAARLEAAEAKLLTVNEACLIRQTYELAHREALIAQVDYDDELEAIQRATRPA